MRRTNNITSTHSILVPARMAAPRWRAIRGKKQMAIIPDRFEAKRFRVTKAVHHL